MTENINISGKYITAHNVEKSHQKVSLFSNQTVKIKCYAIHSFKFRFAFKKSPPKKFRQAVLKTFCFLVLSYMPKGWGVPGTTPLENEKNG